MLTGSRCANGLGKAVQKALSKSLSGTGLQASLGKSFLGLFNPEARR